MTPVMSLLEENARMTSFGIGKFAISDFSMAVIQCYIVYLGAHSHGPTPSSIDLETATHFHYDFLGSILGSHEKAKEAIIYSYNKHINGFAAALEEEEAADIAENPNAVSVFLSKDHKLHITHSWEFLGLQRNGRNTTWQKGRFGENTIISNIDTGFVGNVGSCTKINRLVDIITVVGGQGYSLPADIQYLDARWEVLVVLPLRDCFAQEINMLCPLDGFVVL
ncbi:subtilisin-like protease Glyma18g48580 [Glycine soja]|uniref:subtilisin-like protease Glyma18g48580 n=1 Tax=Glycine soja TaxID=3848 RepID=UPI00103DAB4B|nr:subtilisin-like protease Glyma18g48580 [Glycine soja]